MISAKGLGNLKSTGASEIRLGSSTVHNLSSPCWGFANRFVPALWALLCGMNAGAAASTDGAAAARRVHLSDKTMIALMIYFNYAQSNEHANYSRPRKSEKSELLLYL
jgi:hypothetical protein